MKAYRVNLMGTNDHYLVTEKQKLALDRLMQTKGNSIVEIGGDTIRVNSIKSITFTNVDMDSCPDYFYKAANIAETGEKKPDYRKLPTDWIILSTNGKIIATSASRRAEQGIVAAIKNSNSSAHYLVAKCHYRIGTSGDKEYLTRLEEIPEATEKAVLEDDYTAIVQAYHYGEKLIDPITGKIRGEK